MVDRFNDPQVRKEGDAPIINVIIILSNYGKC